MLWNVNCRSPALWTGQHDQHFRIQINFHWIYNATNTIRTIRTNDRNSWQFILLQTTFRRKTKSSSIMTWCKDRSVAVEISVKKTTKPNINTQSSLILYQKPTRQHINRLHFMIKLSNELRFKIWNKNQKNCQRCRM
jgi:hypothetical protein